MQDLGTLPGGTESYGEGINAKGEITGDSDTTDGSRHAFAWTASGGMHDLGTLGGTLSSGQAINAQGQITGLSYTADGSTHAFLLTP